MKFDPAFLDRVRSRTVLSHVIAPYVTWDRQRSRASKGDFWACCPFHSEKTPSFHVIDHKGFYHCFSCKASGDVFGFLLEKEGLPFHEIVEKLAQEAHIPLPQTYLNSENFSPQKEHTSVLEAASLFFEKSLKSTMGHQAREYLKKRGVSEKARAAFRLGYCPNSGFLEEMHRQNFSDALLEEAGLLGKSENSGRYYNRFRERLIFPITNHRGHLVGFGGRLLDSQGVPKYLNSPETSLFHKKEILYNFHDAKPFIHQNNRCFVVEGYMDVIAMTEAGFSNSVAPLGTALGEEQLVQLWQICREPTICFDGDKAGMQAAHRLLENALPLLKPGLSLKFVFLPQGADPDTLFRKYGTEGLRESLEASSPLIDVLWQHHSKTHDVSTPERCALFEKNLWETVSKIKDPSVKSHYQTSLKGRLRAFFFSQGKNYTSTQNKQKQNSRILSSPISPFLRSASGERLNAVAQERRESLLFFACLNHPFLAEKYAETLAEVDFSVKELDSLLQEILNKTASQSCVDRFTLKMHLLSLGYGACMNAIEAHAETLRATFFSPESDKGVVSTHFEHILTLHHRVRMLQNELENAQNLLVNKPTREHLEHLNDIKQTLWKLQQAEFSRQNPEEEKMVVNLASLEDLL